jgi:hypothetical protein
MYEDIQVEELMEFARREAYADFAEEFGRLDALEYATIATYIID